MSVFQTCLKLVKSKVDKLSGILLLPNIDGRVIPVLVREAEVFGVVVLSVSKLKCGEKALPLMKEVVINVTAFMLADIGRLVVVSAHQREAEDRNVKELLDHGVHITGSTQVFETSEAISSTIAFAGVKVALFGLFHTHD